MKTKLFSLLAVAALFAVACEKNDNPEENGGGNEQPPVEEQFNDIFGEQITAVTESTLWSDDVFNAIIEKNNAGQTTWDFTATADKLGFVENNLGFYGGVWKDAEGADKAGTFKFKKDEKISDTAKKSRVQIGGGKVGERSFIAFRAGGKGTLTLVSRSSGDAERFINVALNADLLSETGYSAPGKAEAPSTQILEVNAANGDVITILSMGSSINVYSIKWIPEGKADIEDGQGGQGGDDPTPTPDPANDPSTAYDPATLEAVSELTTWGATDFNALFKGKVASNKDVTTTAGESFVYNKLVYFAGEGGAFKFDSDHVQVAKGERAVNNNLLFKVAGPGTITVKARGANADDATRKLLVAINETICIETTLPTSKGEIPTEEYTFNEVAEGDIIYIYGSNTINVYGVTWTPAGQEPAPESGSTYVCYYEGSTLVNTNNYFTATAKNDLGGDYSITDWTIGEYSSTKGVKLNSSGAVTFKTAADKASTVQFYFIRRKEANSAKIQLVPATGDPVELETPWDQIADSGVIELEANMGYTIKQATGEQSLLLVIVKEAE